MRIRILSVLLAAMLAGCAAPRAGSGEPDITAAFPNQVVNGGEGSTPGLRYYVQRSAYAFVRVQQIEDGAPPNDAPPACAPDAAALRATLAGLRTRGGMLGGEPPLFTPAELDTLVPPLVQALSAAKPDEDIAIATSGRRGELGRYLGLSANSARVFARGGQLNLIAGLVHYGFEQEVRASSYLRPFTPGARKAALDRFAAIDGAAVTHPVAGREDWVAFALPGCAVAAPVAPVVGAPVNAPVSAPPAPPTVSPSSAQPSSAQPPVPPAAQPAPIATPPAAPSADTPERIEQRLRTLECLREQRLISDDEYRAKRRAILDAL
ncbi:hypothetical protein [Derxia gummosa]|uniref:SHOCT domain-containing protein n=1 Tax=Derxia gummosa DSM 723 TaxID=1121388 RepID=A0A8B6X662_9BURK|nr:hypothetical protein [Derxia gummosa]